MGAENSKPSSEVQQHVFSADHPVRFSNELVDKLQKNTFTDSTRSKQQELQYQERLTAELEKLREQETQSFSKFSETLSGEDDQPSEPSLVEKISDATSSKSTLAEKQRQKDMSNQSVTKEIEQLKAKLEKRKRLEQVDADLSKAKEAVVACLRTNDRRPLDCWKEVETFKKEVGRLEKEFVERTIR
ncbi:Nn.00g096040.m01.CDS01 [Neocucurbitaria sp. VM-36]